MTNRADRPIAVGDLVIVARDHTCCPARRPHLGKIFKVISFRFDDGNCEKCGKPDPFTTAIDAPGKAGYDIRRLKRIPPLDEPAETYTTEPIKEKV